MASSNANSSITVVHDEKSRRFFASVGDGKKAELTYDLSPNGVIDLEHTFVPTELRGKGIAGELMKKALEYSANKNLAVKLSCTYAADYVQKNKEQIQKYNQLKNIKFVEI